MITEKTAENSDVLSTFCGKQGTGCTSIDACVGGGMSMRLGENDMHTRWQLLSIGEFVIYRCGSWKCREFCI